MECVIIELAVAFGIEEPAIVNGKCKGYYGSENDDEPILECRVCQDYERYGVNDGEG